ncbi:hypothetical protein B0H13DRAFT_73789 [Mycena leptocephala]|nr:hypothetical protein B0H13DRAFT_73789 [Mycena leptocephala]
MRLSSFASFDIIRMHHCLRIQEIGGLWCSHLEESESTIALRSYSTIVGKLWKRPALNDLAVVARTCRAFHDPALDALWRSSALVNLLRSMPSDLYHCKESGPEWNVTNVTCRSFFDPLNSRTGTECSFTHPASSISSPNLTTAACRRFCRPSVLVSPSAFPQSSTSSLGTFRQ